MTKFGGTLWISWINYYLTGDFEYRSQPIKLRYPNPEYDNEKICCGSTGLTFFNELHT